MWASSYPENFEVPHDFSALPIAHTGTPLSVSNCEDQQVLTVVVKDHTRQLHVSCSDCTVITNCGPCIVGE